MNSWAACIPFSEAAELAVIRLFPGIECAKVAGTLWLRGNNGSEELEQALRGISDLERFELLESGWLKSAESRIPERILPRVEWQPLKGAMLPGLPTAALPGETRQKLPLTLVRTHTEATPGAILADFDAWYEFAIQAPEIRLKGLRFAVNEERRVSVIGHPVPPIKGLQLVDYSGILIPCGFTWFPAVEAMVLSELFNRGAEDFVIFFEDHTHQIIKPEQLLTASRSAVRETYSKLLHA
ncbi:hypothetical protein [Pedosphaera parvula]|uniref:MoxR-vWA-beta-propeller ternary system domain-containing protein n=1 Tax=Pedosphaera parvula (strain Ellin514) TaxID=320771 RepID=B9XN89_PEDPL|nr:hypothetical protein [Pedosphaera parvula]EEF58751.1 hypothetical protein Cflav_PD1847 [Pedosphaera parvula Ellin514]